MKLRVSIEKAIPDLAKKFENKMPGVIKEIDEAGADYALQELHNRFNQVLKHQTPHYTTHLHVVKDSRGLAVDDDHIIYGPWLEGVGSRNKTTRFKGYATFRYVSQKVRIHTLDIANKAVAKFVKALSQ